MSKTQTVAVDAGYKTPGVVREIFLSGKTPAVPYTRTAFSENPSMFTTNILTVIFCPQNQILKYTTTNREGYREYKSTPLICEHCTCREKCTLSKNMTKVVLRHVWAKYMEEAEHLRHVSHIRDTYKKRKETLERQCQADCVSNPL